MRAATSPPASASACLFTHGPVMSLKVKIAAYCDEEIGKKITLTDAELEQLTWYDDNPFTTPQANAQERQGLNYEVKRGLARYNAFELILQGTQEAYNEFISDQPPENTLSFEAFKELSKEAKQLPEDFKTVIRITTLLTKTKRASELATTKDKLALSDDGEEFLSQLAAGLPLNQDKFPLLRSLSPEQARLLSHAYMPDTHLRHMMYSEGGNNMVKTFVSEVRSGQVTHNDFLVWKWRWLTNLFGFQPGKGAKYFDAEIYQLCTMVLDTLERVFQKPESANFLESYLMARAKFLGVDTSSRPREACLVIGHLAAYFTKINIVSVDLGAAVTRGFDEYCAKNPDSTLLTLYASHLLAENVVTPTFGPAVLANTYSYFMKNTTKNDAIALSTRFICQFFEALYQNPLNERIACSELAQQETLEKILTEWMEDPASVNFNITDRKMTAEIRRPMPTMEH